jgi:hypothetical protein
MNFRSSQNFFLLNSQLTDYARLGVGLFWQRILIYTVAYLLAAFYYSWILAVLSLAVLIISEIFDYVTFRKILRLKKRSVRDRRICMRLLVVGTVLSALNIAGFAISIAILQGHTTHFMSLFFLLAAAIFATINNYTASTPKPESSCGL